MSDFKIVPSLDKIKLSSKWKEALKFDAKGDIVDQVGKKVDSSMYMGRCYQLISKKERPLSNFERFVRRILGLAVIIFSLGTARKSKKVNDLFTKKKLTQKFGVPHTVVLKSTVSSQAQAPTPLPAPSLTQPPLVISGGSKTDAPESPKEIIPVPKNEEPQPMNPINIEIHSPIVLKNPSLSKPELAMQNDSEIKIKKLKDLIESHKLKTELSQLQPSGADGVGNYTERFELSLEPKQPQFPIQEWTGLFAVPHVGVYANWGLPFKAGDIEYGFYQWSPQIIMIRLPNAAIWEIIPKTMRKVLEEKGHTEASMQDPENVRCNLNISGNPFYMTGAQDATIQSPKGYNISFHSTLFPPNTKGGNLNPFVGIFDSKNVNSLDIPVNAVEERDVSLHEDETHACSPDNIRYEVAGPIAQYWSLALVGAQIVITSHIVFNDDKLEAKVRAISANSKNLSELVFGLKQVGLPPESLDMLMGMFGNH